MKLNHWQKAILRDYADGDFSYLADHDEIWNPAELGDALLSFLLIELSTEEGCETFDDATDRITSGQRDLEAALQACVHLQLAFAAHIDAH
jgi:hypothetical protein